MERIKEIIGWEFLQVIAKIFDKEEGDVIYMTISVGQKTIATIEKLGETWWLPEGDGLYEDLGKDQYKAINEVLKREGYTK